MYCRNCGKEVADNQDVCLNCGVSLKKSDLDKQLGGYNKWLMAIISCPFLFGIGCLGIHNFMLGENKKGIFKIIFTFVCGISSIFALIDFIKILIDKYEIDPEKYI